MLEKIINFSIRNKLIIFLFTATVAAFGVYAVFNIPVGAVPDNTNNQVQVITTSGNLSTQEIEQFITAPVEMEMANLPGVQEIRSVSKFGISVVTVVFKERLGTYLPRQLIAEKIKSASAKIPEGFGVPEMGPITTGLGEVYQYIVDVKPGYEGRYSAMELRTIQDWVIKRRLSGINGVVEINSWGGLLKQYEIAISPERLRSRNITLLQVFDAVEANNSISGGAYIEKENQSYFIRGDGQVKDIKEIEQIVVENNEGTPVFIKDVAEVRYGHANRFGAITANGKGETVLGQIMMLKNANSKEVISEVKSRVAEVQQNLPEGVFINPILERSELIGKTTFTVFENLILGAIIVMLTVILLLGNLRSALVIASMIPLALLFTLSMMYIFGIDANLMSLGALDFGIIIDGAVIIVEFIAIRITVNRDEINSLKGDNRMKLMDRISADGASKMMNSAIFGQIIILIVFIPILSLTGVEGKMFRPMALAFSFAILGAMIFGLTWLPVISSVFLKPLKSDKPTLSDKLMAIAHKSYLPSIKWALGHKRMVFGAAILSLALTIAVFINMGGEFVPTLDEGDFVIQPVLKTGTSLTKTIELTTKMENILLQKFPEVDQIVSRIGAAEVPTDPMSMEEIDMIIKLHPRKQWVSADNKEALAEKFKEALSVIPGIEYEFTQPIEMRFNELVTGVRSDIAIKLFGEDLDYINEKAKEIEKLVRQVPGAGDVIIEKTAGLPQVRVTYLRDRIAQYGVDTKTLNGYLSAAFGGQFAGVLFEGEKRFDMVVRLPIETRTDIDAIRQLQVPVMGGQQVPLSQLADINYTEGPAKISRENTHRRVVVAVNVRNRDLQSVIEDIRAKIDSEITLQPGNYIEYGGQFENLNNATRRLMLAVPVAMLLILIFLHLAFQSFKDAIMIFSAIPLATVGGVFLLWVRGMPFSVSAGVGFIALFGIAVLNGIVLIEHLKELQHEGKYSIRDLILNGTRNRLRPVLLTAGAAAMGFLPMAISSGAGAEVQRPLATVVIGGLFTSTFLTMILLPLLYEVFYTVKSVQLFPFRIIRKSSVILLIGLMVPALASAQSAKPAQTTAPAQTVQPALVLTLDQVIAVAKQQAYSLKAAAYRIEEAKALRGTAFEIDKTSVTYGLDENNIAENGFPLYVWGVQQQFSFPTLYAAEWKSRTLGVELAGISKDLEEQKLIKSVSMHYVFAQYALQKVNLYRELDSLYRILVHMGNLRKNAGDISNISLLALRAESEQTLLLLEKAGAEYNSALKRLQAAANFDSAFAVVNTLPVIPAKESNVNFITERMDKELQLSNQLLRVEKNRMLPDLSATWFTGSNKHENAQTYDGWEVGLSIPLFYGSQRSKIRGAKFSSMIQEQSNEQAKLNLNARLAEYRYEQAACKRMIESYEENGKALYNEIIRTAGLEFEHGNIDFFQLSQNIGSAKRLHEAYLDNVMRYNTLTLELNYLTD